MPVGPANFPAIASVDPTDPLAADPACQAELTRQSPNLRVFRTLATKPCRVRLTLYFYPYWRASDESGNNLPTVRESTGFLLIDVPPGSHNISLAFRPASQVRTSSAIVSLASLLLFAAVLLLNQWRGRRHSPQQAAPQVP
jgi:hypothetical protein